jgi:hypothetical protein
MNFTHEWNTQFEATPADTAYKSTGAASIWEIKKAIRERMSVEHRFDLTDDTNQGLHCGITKLCTGTIALNVEDSNVTVETTTANITITLPNLTYCYNSTLNKGKVINLHHYSTTHTYKVTLKCFGTNTFTDETTSWDIGARRHNVMLVAVSNEKWEKIPMDLPKGTIVIWGGQVVDIPGSWFLCDGTNGTPNLKGKFIVGYSTITPSDYDAIGKTGGTDTVTLSIANLAAHTHGMTKSLCVGSGLGSCYENGTTNTGSTGGGNSHPNLPPYYVLTYIMRK